MLNAGLVGEVQNLIDNGVKKDMTSMQGLGYKEIAAYLTGEYDLDTAVNILKRDTRHFAKRQLTWYKREKVVTYFNKDEYDTEDDLVRAVIDRFKAI